jgi:hypothetical protein
MMQLAQQAMRSGGDSPEEMQQAIAKNMDICQIGRSIIVKLERLPSGTKSRPPGRRLLGRLLHDAGPDDEHGWNGRNEWLWPASRRASGL